MQSAARMNHTPHCELKHGVPSWNNNFEVRDIWYYLLNLSQIHDIVNMDGWFHCSSLSIYVPLWKPTRLLGSFCRRLFSWWVVGARTSSRSRRSHLWSLLLGVYNRITHSRFTLVLGGDDLIATDREHIPPNGVFGLVWVKWESYGCLTRLVNFEKELDRLFMIIIPPLWHKQHLWCWSCLLLYPGISQHHCAFCRRLNSTAVWTVRSFGHFWVDLVIVLLQQWYWGWAWGVTWNNQLWGMFCSKFLL